MSTPNDSRLQPGSPSTWLNRLNPFDFLRQQGSEGNILPEKEDDSDEQSSEGDTGDEDLHVDELLWEAQVRLSTLHKLTSEANVSIECSDPTRLWQSFVPLQESCTSR